MAERGLAAAEGWQRSAANCAFRSRPGVDWSAVRRGLESLAPLDSLSVLRAPQGGV